MSEKDKRKYLTVLDIFDKETRIDLIMDMLDLIDFDNLKPIIAVKYIAKVKGIEEEKLIRLLPDVIQQQIQDDMDSVS